MSRFELVKQTLLGNIGDSVPVSVWKHHPRIDRTSEGLAEAEIALHRMFDHDIIKISFHGCYPVVDWGCVPVYEGEGTGSTRCTSCAVCSSADWETLEPLDVSAGEFGRQVRAVQLIHEYAQSRVPTMATVFDPPMVADLLCNGKLKEYMDKNSDIVKGALELITGVMIDFARAALDAGADGIFLASQHATYEAVTDRQYDEFILPYDVKVLSRLRRKAGFILMHLHSEDEDKRIRFEKISRIASLDGLNWADQKVAPTLRQMKNETTKAVFGGIDHTGVLRTGTVDEVKGEVLQAIQAAGLERLVVAPGCVIPVDAPEENIHAAVDATRSIVPWDKEWEAYR
jgi:uroporphyrinogen decarboxylase